LQQPEVRKSNYRDFVSPIKVVRESLKAAKEEYIITHIGAHQKLSNGEREKQMADAVRLLAAD